MILFLNVFQSMCILLSFMVMLKWQTKDAILSFFNKTVNSFYRENYSQWHFNLHDNYSFIIEKSIIIIVYDIKLSATSFLSRKKAIILLTGIFFVEVVRQSYVNRRRIRILQSAVKVTLLMHLSVICLVKSSIVSTFLRTFAKPLLLAGF